MGFEGLAERLRPRAAELAVETDSQSVYFVESTWRDWLRRAEIDDDVVEAVFAGIGNGAVTRPELREVALQADDPLGRLMLLIATLIWGRGQSNGRMRDPIVRVLCGHSRDEVLHRTAKLARAGQAAAYAEWKLPGTRAGVFQEVAMGRELNEVGFVSGARQRRVGQLEGARVEQSGGSRPGGIGIAVCGLCGGVSPMCRVRRVPRRGCRARLVPGGRESSGDLSWVEASKLCQFRHALRP